jgi:hypothetical protein
MFDNCHNIMSLLNRLPQSFQLPESADSGINGAHRIVPCL